MRAIWLLPLVAMVACDAEDESTPDPGPHLTLDEVPPAEPEDDGCRGVDFLGACDGATALFCHQGELRSVDCGEHGLECGWVDDQTGYYCGGSGTSPGAQPAPPVEDPPQAPPPGDPPSDEPPAEDDCASLGRHGRCDGDVAVWCDSAMQIRRADCAAEGERCGWVNDDVGYYCGGEGGGGDDQEPTPPDDPPSPEASCGSAAEQAVVELANAARITLGLGALRCEAAMNRAARLHSEDMCRSQYFDHQAPDGSQPGDRLRRAGVDFRAAGENIAWGYASATSAHEGWMTSPGHRANLLDGWGRIGVGLAACGGDHYWTQVFAD